MTKNFFALAFLLFGASFAQKQAYIHTTDTFAYQVEIYDDVAIGELAFTTVLYVLEGGGLDVDTDIPANITNYRHTGIDAHGTLTLFRDQTFYTLSGTIATENSYVISINISRTLMFESGQDGPHVELDIRQKGNGKIGTTLVNTDVFDVFTE